jgi:hypothetical protein
MIAGDDGQFMIDGLNEGTIDVPIRVVDGSGKPVADREVRASAADRLENRYYDPTVKTAVDGTFDLKFIHAGEQYIQVAPFWLDAKQAPAGSSHTVILEPGETKEGVDLKVQAN